MANIRLQVQTNFDTKKKNQQQQQQQKLRNCFGYLIIVHQK